MITKAQAQANSKYDAKNTVQKKLKLNKKTDFDILDHIHKKNFQGYVKTLIREDMENEKKPKGERHEKI